MIKDLLNINPEEESRRIAGFIKKTLIKQGFENVVLGISGGLDSTTVYHLLNRVIKPDKIITINFPYFDTIKSDSKLSAKVTIPINQIINDFCQELKTKEEDITSKIRRGNIVARVRMTILFDLAKKNHALVCGTENRSERLLGYYTRFGDQASDLEPILHLYKTQVKQLARYLKVSEEIINKTPTADLWPGQTDEDELGFSYEEADKVLCFYCDKKMTVEKIINLGLTKAKKIVNYYKQNRFKELVPYHL